jgi:hypothetical protein
MTKTDYAEFIRLHEQIAEEANTILEDYCIMQRLHGPNKHYGHPHKHFDKVEDDTLVFSEYYCGETDEIDLPISYLVDTDWKEKLVVELQEQAVEVERKRKAAKMKDDEAALATYKALKIRFEGVAE